MNGKGYTTTHHPYNQTHPTLLLLLYEKRAFPSKRTGKAKSFPVKLMILMGFQTCNKSTVLTSLPQVDKITASDSLFDFSGKNFFTICLGKRAE